MLPELAGPLQQNSRNLDGPTVGPEARELRQWLGEDVHAAEDKEGCAETGDGAAPDLQMLAVESFLVIADAEAWASDRLRVIFLDARGNAVRYSRLPLEESFDVRGVWFRPSWWD